MLSYQCFLLTQTLRWLKLNLPAPDNFHLISRSFPERSVTAQGAPQSLLIKDSTMSRTVCIFVPLLTLWFGSSLFQRQETCIVAIWVHIWFLDGILWPLSYAISTLTNKSLSLCSSVLRRTGLHEAGANDNEQGLTKRWHSLSNLLM